MSQQQLLQTLDIVLNKKNDPLPKNYKALLSEAQAETLPCYTSKAAHENVALQKEYQKNRAAGIRIKTIGDELQKRLSEYTPCIIGLYQLRPYIKLPYWLAIIISSEHDVREVQKTLEHHGFKRSISTHSAFPLYSKQFQRNAFTVSLLQKTPFVKHHHFEAADSDESKELLLLIDTVLTLWLQQGWSQTWYVALLVSCMMQEHALNRLSTLTLDTILLHRLIEELQQQCTGTGKPDSLFQKMSQHSNSSIQKLYFLYQQGSLTMDLLYQTLRRVS